MPRLRFKKAKKPAQPVKKKTISKTSVKEGIKDPGNNHEAAAAPTGKPPKQIQMTMTLSGPAGVFMKGKTYQVPQEVSNDTARRWVRSGAADDVSP